MTSVTGSNDLHTNTRNCGICGLSFCDHAALDSADENFDIIAALETSIALVKMRKAGGKDMLRRIGELATELRQEALYEDLRR